MIRISLNFEQTPRRRIHSRSRGRPYYLHIKYSKSCLLRGDRLLGAGRVVGGAESLGGHDHGPPLGAVVGLGDDGGRVGTDDGADGHEEAGKDGGVSGWVLYKVVS